MCGSQLVVCLVSLFVSLSLVRVVIICLASTHTALVSSPSLTVVHLSTYIHIEVECVCVCVCVRDAFRGPETKLLMPCVT